MNMKKPLSCAVVSVPEPAAAACLRDIPRPAAKEGESLKGEPTFPGGLPPSLAPFPLRAACCAFRKARFPPGGGPASGKGLPDGGLRRG